MIYNPTGITYKKKYKGKEVCWYVIINEKKTADGKYPRRFINTHLPIRGNSKKAEKILVEELEKYRQELIKEEEKNNLIKFGVRVLDGSQISFVDYLRDYIENKKMNWRESTYHGYVWVVSKIEKYFDQLHEQPKLSEINHLIINQMFKKFQKDKLKVSSLKNLENLMRPALKQAYIDEIIPNNPYDKVVLEKQPIIDTQVEQPYLNDKQMIEFLSIIDNHPLKDIYTISLFTGMRRSELLGLRWSNIDFEGKTILISGNVQKFNKEFSISELNKPGRSRATQVGIEIVFDCLKQIKEDIESNKRFFGSSYNNKYEDFVCVNKLGNLYNPDYLTKELKKIVRENSTLPNIHLHSLRHSFCTFVYNHTEDIYQASIALRHSRLETTKRYTHSGQDLEKKKATTQKLDDDLNNLINTYKNNE